MKTKRNIATVDERGKKSIFECLHSSLVWMIEPVWMAEYKLGIHNVLQVEEEEEAKTP